MIMVSSIVFIRIPRLGKNRFKATQDVIQRNPDFISDEFRIIHSGSERRDSNGMTVILRGK